MTSVAACSEPSARVVAMIGMLAPRPSRQLGRQVSVGAQHAGHANVALRIEDGDQVGAAQGKDGDLVRDLLIDDPQRVAFTTNGPRQVLVDPAVQHQPMADGGDFFQLQVVEGFGQLHVAADAIVLGPGEVVADDARRRPGAHPHRQGSHEGKRHDQHRAQSAALQIRRILRGRGSGPPRLTPVPRGAAANGSRFEGGMVSTSPPSPLSAENRSPSSKEGWRRRGRSLLEDGGWQGCPQGSPLLRPRVRRAFRLGPHTASSVDGESGKGVRLRGSPRHAYTFSRCSTHSTFLTRSSGSIGLSTNSSTGR